MGVLDELKTDIRQLLKTGEEIARLQETLLFKIDMSDKKNFDMDMAGKIRDRVHKLQTEIYFPLKEKLGL